MKTWFIGALAVAMTVATSTVMACPVGNNQEPPRKPVVQNASFQASELFERAQQLETAASSHERQAVAFAEALGEASHRVESLAEALAHAAKG